MKSNQTKNEEKKCEVSGIYGKDNNKNLYFYCEFCGDEMDYNEDRICKASQVDKNQSKEDFLDLLDKENK